MSAPFELWRTLARAAREGRPACRLACIDPVGGDGSVPGTFAVVVGFPDAGERWFFAWGEGSGDPGVTGFRQAWRAGGERAARRAMGDGRLHLEVAGDPPFRLVADPILPPPRLVLAGAGHVAAAVAPLARTVGFEVTVVDDRPEMADPARFSGAQVVLGDPVKATAEAAVGPATFVVVATRSHELDRAVLRALAGRPLAYLGVLASRRRAERLRQELGLDGQGGPAGQPAGAGACRLRGPVGLDLGAETPAEIAVSIVAELVAVRRGARVLGPGADEQAQPGAKLCGVAAGDPEGAQVWSAVARSLEEGQPCALATVVAVSGSAPRRPGARMLVRADGRFAGSVGGGRWEAEVLRRCLRSMASGQTQTLRAEYDDERDALCGGAAEVLIEPVLPAPPGQAAALLAGTPAAAGGG